LLIQLYHRHHHHHHNNNHNNKRMHDMTTATTSNDHGFEHRGRHKRPKLTTATSRNYGFGGGDYRIHSNNIISSSSLSHYHHPFHRPAYLHIPTFKKRNRHEVDQEI
jgi:hypothetical protein